MIRKYSKILEEVSEKIKIPDEKNKCISKELDLFLNKIQKRIKKLNLEVEIYIGGSFAKGTLIKKNIYDVDIYLRFGKKYLEEDFEKLTKKILRKSKRISKIKGSRNYFRTKINFWLYFEIIPVCSIKNSNDVKNITDLSYSHVNYVRKKIKKEKILDDIKLAKAFCQANKVYGAESYIQGFSGYSLELLIYYYGGFINFLKGLTKKTKDKIIIDTEKIYKNKKQIMFDINSSKLESPIILIDPTFKRRNALAALSEESFEKFKNSAKEFLNSPSTKFFEIEEKNFEERKNDLKKNEEFILIEIKTKKQEGDIAGTKLLKFFKHLNFEFSSYFEIVDSDFEYLGNQKGKGYFILKRKKEILLRGPIQEDKKHSLIFSEKHKNVFVIGNRIYSKKKVNFSARDFLNNWVKEKRKKIKEMYISEFKII